MLTIGLTGGIASGKSTASALFQDLGVPVVDADLIAREIVKPGTPALKEIATHFGAATIRPDGTLNRDLLGQIVFKNPKKRKILNAITHPRIASLGQEKLDELCQQGHHYAIYDAALIVENSLQHHLDRLIVVWVHGPVQLARLIKRDHITSSAANRRIASQFPLSEKIKVADYLIDNSDSLNRTESQVREIHQKIISGNKGRKNNGFPTDTSQ